jgi:hypothetical protein
MYRFLLIIISIIILSVFDLSAGVKKVVYYDTYCEVIETRAGETVKTNINGFDVTTVTTEHWVLARVQLPKDIMEITSRDSTFRVLYNAMAIKAQELCVDNKDHIIMKYMSYLSYEWLNYLPYRLIENGKCLARRNSDGVIKILEEHDASPKIGLAYEVIFIILTWSISIILCFLRFRTGKYSIATTMLVLLTVAGSCLLGLVDGFLTADSTYLKAGLILADLSFFVMFLVIMDTIQKKWLLVISAVLLTLSLLLLLLL